MPVMDGGEDCGKCPYDKSPCNDDHQLPSRRVRTDISSSQHCRCLGESLLYAVVYLGLLLRHDADLHPLTSSGLLFWMC
jgi:hypothetical protein